MSELITTTPAPSAAPHSAAPESHGPTFNDLQERAAALLRNPLVLAGGAVVLGLVIARLTAGNKIRETAAHTLGNLLKGKAWATFFPDAAPSPAAAPTPATPPAPEPAASTTQANPAAPWIAAGKQILDSVAPNLMEQMKKRLAEVLPNKHN